MTGAHEGVVCVGGALVDLLARPVPRLPAPGRLELAEEMRLVPGGCAVNAASGLARLGMPVWLVGKVGEDDLGRYLAETLVRRGVQVEALRRTPAAATSASMILVAPDGERAIVHSLGATATLSPADVDWEAVGGARALFIAQALLLGGFDGEPAARVLSEARARGMFTAMDTVWDASGAWMEKLAPALPHLDYFLPSYDEARALSGQDEPAMQARFFRDRGVRTVAIKLGVEGCYLADGSRDVRVPALPVEAVDATGAGDAWCAGFLAGLLRGMELEQAGWLGNAVGACSVTALGAYDGIRGLDETLAFMRSAAAA